MRWTPREWVIQLGGAILAIAIGIGVQDLWAAAHWPGAFEAGAATGSLGFLVVLPAVTDGPSARTARVLLIRVLVVALGTVALHFVR